VVESWNPRRNTVLHTDLCTPLATSPTWSKLKQDEKEHFRKNGTPLWRDLAKMLEPSVIHISVPDDQVPQGLRDLSWRPFRPAENAEDEEMRSATFGNANIVWARSGRAPFFYLNRDHWETAAAEILRGLSR